jgi:hypothetical protein
MGKIVTELGASLGILLTDLGLRSGLWAALRDAGPVSVADLAARPWGKAGLQTIKASAADLVVRLERSAEDGLPIL